MASVEKCKLCGKETLLRKSHIIPRFAVKWLKESSLTGYIRDMVSRRRQQESKREYILCDDCEQLLARDEKQFCESIFIPYHERAEQSFDYGPWLKRFLVGLHWRVLVTSTATHAANIEAAFATATQVWGEFLLGQRPDAGVYEFHMFFADVVKETTRRIPDKFNWYLARGFDATPVFSDAGDALVYAKLIKILTVSFLTRRDANKEGWVGTQVFDQGALHIPQRMATTYFGRFLEERARLIEKAPPTLTQRQLEKLARRVEEEPEVLLSSESYKVHLADSQLRQRLMAHPAAVVVKGRERNRSCPCGSGRKAKKCCANI